MGDTPIRRGTARRLSLRRPTGEVTVRIVPDLSALKSIGFSVHRGDEVSAVFRQAGELFGQWPGAAFPLVASGMAVGGVADGSTASAGALVVPGQTTVHADPTVEDAP